MAEIDPDSTSLKMDFKSLYCSICHCLFNKPKTLPCQHSYCYDCLKSYIMSKARKLSSPESLKQFPCPLCQTVIHQRDDFLPVEEWARSFPTSYNLVSLKDELLSERNRKKKLPKCTIHSKKRVKFFCSNCNIFLCSLCTAKTHKTCRTVQTLTEAVNEISNTKSQLCVQLITKKTELEKMCSNLKELRISMMNNKQMVVREIQNETELITKLLQEIREREREAVNILEDLHSANQLVLGEALSRCESNIDSINFCQNLIDQNALENVSETDFLQGISTAKRKYDELPATMPVAPDIQFLSFQPYSCLQQQLQRLVKQPLGKVISQHDPEDQTSDVISSAMETESTLADVLSDGSAFPLNNVSTVATMCNCIITDVALLPDRFLVVTDSLSCKVKIFTEEGELFRQIQLEGPPWGVCRLLQGEIAVTIPSQKKITYLSNADSLRVEWKAKTQRKYLGIAPLYEELFVCASAANSCVDIISSYGIVYQSFSRGFVHPTYVALKENYILVTDSHTKSVIYCDHHGHELFRYTGQKGQGLTEPGGICINRQGSVFVADLKNHNVYKIRILPLLTNFQQLSLAGLAISRDNKLVLTHSDKENKVSGISIFHD